MLADVPPEEQALQHNLWVQDCCIRLLCVFALDRFGDYVSGDQVVVPVRETCAQVLGALCSHLNREDVLRAYDTLINFQRSDKWEVRHGSLLGLKYLVAVRVDLMEEILPSAIDFIIKGFVVNMSKRQCINDE